MNRLVPHPVLSLLLLLMWLLLTRFSLAHGLLGSAVALVAGWALTGLHPQGPRLRRWGCIARLIAVVARDIVQSNAAVAWLILTGRRRRSGCITVPLALRNDSALAILAIVLTATPGTAWLDYDRSTGILLLHVFDLVDEAAIRDQIKTRYEAPLLEIFG